jgi:DNA repair exonuclease SbcCD ATPase subunit
MIKLNSINIKNAGRFVGEHKLDLSELSGLVQVNGKNNNSGGSSGSGKSTIFECIMYALGIGNVPSTVLQSRLTKDPLSVELSFKKDDLEYFISRSKSDGLIFKTPTQTYTGSNKVAEEELQKILSLPVDLVSRVLHKRQKERGFFMSLTPKQTHAFLSTCLGLEEWTRKQTKSQENLKSAEALKESLSSDLSQKMALLEYAKSNLSKLSEPKEDPEHLQQSISNLNKNIEDIKKQLEIIESEKLSELSKISYSPATAIQKPAELMDLETKIVSIKNSISSAKNEKQKKLIDCLNKIKKIENSILKSETDSQNLRTVQQNLNSLKEEIIKLRESVCPTCEQSWENGHQNSRLNFAIEEYKKLMAKEELLKLSINESAGLPEQLKLEKETLSKIELDTDTSILEKELLDLEEKKSSINDKYIADLNEVNLKNSALMAENKKRTEEVTKKYTDLSSPLVFDLNNKTTLAVKLSSDLDSLKKTISYVKEQKAKSEQEVHIFESCVKEIQEKIGANQGEIEKTSIATKVIESYINFSFQNSLAQIASRANEILSKVSNTATTTISFDSYKETKSGSIKEEVSILVHMDDELKVPLKSLSGGEETAIELAVDLAVIEMIEQRSGIGFDTYILDEPFDGLDSVCKANCLDVLSNSGIGKKIIIVDHSEETKEMISSKVTVVRDNQTSRIEVLR